MTETYSCHICNNKLDGVHLFGVHSPASLFRDSAEPEAQTDSFGYGFCTHCKMLNNTCSQKTLFSPREFDWVKYSEPEYHFKEVISSLKTSLNQGAKIDFIIGLSYKDDSLVNAIKRELNINGSTTDIIHTTQKWRGLNSQDAVEAFTEEVSLLTKGHDNILILARRVLDQCANVPSILRSLNGLNKEITLYAEFNDYVFEIEKKNLSFIWNERTFYPLSSQVEHILQETGFQMQSVTTSAAGDNSLLFLLASNSLPVRHESDAEVPDQDQLKMQFEKNFNLSRKLWDRILSNGRTCVIGASHKGISFTQIFGENIESKDLVIADGSSDKSGKFHPNRQQQIISQDEAKSLNFENLVITVDFKWLGKIKEELDNGDAPKKFYDFEGRSL